MAINPKPFTKAEKIRRREFGPKPRVYTHVDINQNAEATVIAIEELARRTGGIAENLALTLNGVALTKPTLTTYKLDWDIDFASISGTGADPFFFVHKNVRFSTTYTNVASSNTQTFLPKVSFWLKAKQKVVTFVADPVMAGVDGPGFPSPIASSDAIVWEGEAIVPVLNGVFPALASGEEFICQIASIGYEDVTYTGSAVGYVPYLMLDTPPIDDPATWASFFEQFQSQDNPTGQSLFSTDARQWLKIKELSSKVNVLIPTYGLFEAAGAILDDFLLFTSGITGNKFRPVQINSVIENRPHTQTELFTPHYTSLGTTNFYSTSLGNFNLVAENNNSFILQAPEFGVLNDIVMYYIPPFGLFPAVTIPMPTGSVINFRVTYDPLSAGPGDESLWGTNVTKLLDDPSIIMPREGTEGSWIMLKTATTWQILSGADYSHKLSSYLVNKTNSLQTQIGVLNGTLVSHTNTLTTHTNKLKHLIAQADKVMGFNLL